jgi:hypothetical protein
VTKADVAELVDARDLKSLDGNVVWVRVPPPAPKAYNAGAFTGITTLEINIGHSNKRTALSIPMRASDIPKYECLADQKTDAAISIEWSNGGFSRSRERPMNSIT